MQTLLVFSHLRWDFVYQRPQHLLSRLAKHYRVLFFEEPVRGNQTPFLQRIAPCANVEVLRPHTTVDAVGFHDDQLPELKHLLAEYLSDFSIDSYLVWFYTPMALPLLADLTPQAVIYDCMDELSAFKNAPRQMIQREKALLKRAQLVLAGGPSLYEAKRRLHPRARCFPSAVDAEHFSPRESSSNRSSVGVSSPHVTMPVLSVLPSSDRKRSPYREDAEELHAKIAYPRLGFFGVIDERFDAELIAAVADAAPNWQLVMVGPIVKIDPESLPNRANIHWLGQQPYEVLPHLVAQWDVCLLPFARNESTRFISPTKTLEYMAAEKPIVSTPVHDVVSLYGDSVSIAASAGEFISACAAHLAESAADRRLRIERMRGHVSRCTWDRTAREIHQEIEAVLRLRDDAMEVVEVEDVRRASSSTRNAEALRVQAVDRVGARATNEAVMPSIAAQ
ncbi:MAG TPA: glycosyltransferase [Burkholderiaceae bacterium]|nr:glycosyltransferase [Burkholderiaceae bacterium]